MRFPYLFFIPQMLSQMALFKILITKEIIRYLNYRSTEQLQRVKKLKSVLLYSCTAAKDI